MTEETPKRSLAVILSDIAALDDMIEGISEEEAKALFDQLKDKVDDYWKAVEAFESGAEKNSRKAEKYAKKAKAFRRRLDDLLSRMAFYMQSSGFERLPGVESAARLKLNPPKVVLKAEPTRELYVKYGQFMTVDYGWKKSELKPALEAGDPDALVIASLERGVTVEWDSIDSPKEQKKRTKKGA